MGPNVNFSSSFLLSHLSHCLSVPLPKPKLNSINHTALSCANFVNLPEILSALRPNISLIPCSNAQFPCLIVVKQTQTQAQILTIEQTQFSVIEHFYLQRRSIVTNLFPLIENLYTICFVSNNS